MSQRNLAPSTAGLAPTNRGGDLDVAIRHDVRAADRDIVREVVTRTKFFRNDEIEVAVELVDEHLARGPASGYFFAFVEMNDFAIGYACYGPIACTVASFDLYWIAVDPRFQRFGVGKRLLADVERRIAAAGGRQIYVDTSGRADYAPTRAFYERSGFRCEARLKDYYAPGDDRLIFAKTMSNCQAGC